MSTQTFTETDHPRGADGKFAPKPSAAEAQVQLGAPSSYEEVMGTHDEERYDTYQEAHDAASEVATAGFTGVVHEEAHYDEDTDIDGQRTFTSQDYEVRVFETEEEMADYAERTGVEFSADRDDIASSVDDYHDPYSSDVETHTIYVERPAPAATQPVGPEDISPKESSRKTALRPATRKEEQDWLQGYSSIPGAEETEEGLMVPDNHFNPDDIATCGSCGRSWDIEAYPTPASLCPFCNGDDRAAAEYERRTSSRKTSGRPMVNDADHAVLESEWRQTFDALRTAGLEADADHPIAARYRATSDAVNHANRSRDFAILTGQPTQPVGPEDISPGMVIDHHGSPEEVMGVQDHGDGVVLQLDTEDVPVGPGQRVQMVRPAPGL